ncbi:MAG: NAD-dependent succinate-semialdehyde dehydrogenase [Candidatus Dormibacteria bacterium]
MATALAQFRSVNPATGKEIEVFDVTTGGEVDATLKLVADRAPRWAATPLAARAQLLHDLAAVLRRDVDLLAATSTAEMGKTLAEARAEVEKCAFGCDYFADNAAQFLADEPSPSDSPASFITFEPLGTVLACMPWNFPYWQVIRCFAPAIAAGNCVVLKHANNVTRCALRLADAIRDAGFPEGVFAVLIIPVDMVGGVIADPRINAVSLTGSTEAGRSVGSIAGAHLKKSVLELGGSDAFVVLDDADMAAAAAMAAKSRFQNAGQSCIAAKRFIVAESVAEDFEERLAAEARAIRVGDPTDPATTMGPLARSDLRRSLRRQLDESVAAGAEIIQGGNAPDGPGFYFEPTVIRRCTVGMPAFTEETFGPLAAVMRVRDDDEAVAVANHTTFGLGGNVWSGNPDRGLAVASRMHTGGVFINGMTHSDPRLPFGGIGESGYGRELHRYGLHELVNIKTMWRPAG